uniref:L1 transposable element RRM domain-containing protein n=1 Tax=Sparus aurata TaxID=8175 RepID=A0A671XL39_SPAAU
MTGWSATLGPHRGLSSLPSSSPYSPQTSTSPMAEEAPLTLKALKCKLQLSRQASLADFKVEIDTLRQDLSGDIEALRTETITNSQKLRREFEDEIGKLRRDHTDIAAEQAAMAKSLNDALERIAELDRWNDLQSREMKRLHEKCTDLESRSRRQNLRIIRVPEGAEGASATRFMADFFTEVLGPENFTSPVIIDRAHRSLASKPKSERILGISKGKGRLFYRDTPVHIFPDLPAEVGKLRAAFNPVKAKLRAAKVEYSLFFPAVLSVNFNGVRHKFNTPESAAEFYHAEIAPRT